MRITFQRVLNERYRVEVLRDDGVRVAVPTYDRTAPMPHDLAHYVIEQSLGLDKGFWGSVAAGALLPGMAVIGGRQKPHAAELARAVSKANHRSMVDAEILVSTFMPSVEAGARADTMAIRRRLKEHQLGNHGLDADTVEQVCDQLKRMQKQWLALNNRQSLTLEWPGSPARAPFQRRAKASGRKRLRRP